MAKQKEAPIESKGKLQDTMDKLEKQFGIGTVITLNSRSKAEYDVVSTGSIGFDWVTLGVGGFVYGKVYELMGWEGTGKSTVGATAVANCQKQDKRALYIDAECAVDKNYFSALGVDVSKMLLAKPGCGEDGFDIVIEMIKSGEVDLIVIDSDSALVPKKAAEGPVEDSTIGRKAMLNSRAYPNIKRLADEYHVCVIVISQFREKIGVMYGSPTTTQGGNALKFYNDCRIEISKVTALKDGDNIYGTTMKVVAKKYKIAAPYRVSKFNIIFGQGIDKYGEVVDLGSDLDIIKKSGSWYSYGETKIGQGRDAVVELLMDNPELYEELRIKILDKIRDSDIVVELEKEVV